MKYDQAEEGFNFIISTLTYIGAGENGEALSIVRIMPQLFTIYQALARSQGSSAPAIKDKPKKIADKIKEIVQKILVSSGAYNYLRAKATVL